MTIPELNYVCQTFLCHDHRCYVFIPGRGGDSLKEGNGDVPLDGVAFLRLD